MDTVCNGININDIALLFFIGPVGFVIIVVAFISLIDYLNERKYERFEDWSEIPYDKVSFNKTPNKATKDLLKKKRKKKK